MNWSPYSSVRSPSAVCLRLPVRWCVRSSSVPRTGGAAPRSEIMREFAKRMAMRSSHLVLDSLGDGELGALCERELGRAMHDVRAGARKRRNRRAARSRVASASRHAPTQLSYIPELTEFSASAGRVLARATRTRSTSSGWSRSSPASTSAITGEAPERPAPRQPTAMRLGRAPDSGRRSFRYESEPVPVGVQGKRSRHRRQVLRATCDLVKEVKRASLRR